MSGAVAIASEAEKREAEATSRCDEASGTGFIYSGWCQAALPHRRPIDDAAGWRVETDSMTLLVEPGMRLEARGGARHVGVPFGAVARLILIYLQTEALRTGSRDIELGGSLRAFLGRLGMSVGGRTSLLVREQAERISRCRLSFHSVRNGRAGMFINQNIVEVAMLSDGIDDAGQCSMFVEVARLGEGFFAQLSAHAVPLDEAAIRSIRGSSMALDVYCWLAYRLHSLSAPKTVGWTALASQFGTGIKLRKHFTSSMREALTLASAAYPAARVDISPMGLTLHPSPPPVARLARRTTGISA